MENMHVLKQQYPKVNVRPYHFPAIYLFWVIYFISLSLSFLIYKMGMHLQLHR